MPNRIANRVTTENVYKFLYLANEYPKKKITEVAALMQLPALEINCAIWMAQDLGRITVNEKKQTFTVDTVPDQWELGDEVQRIMNNLVYVFTRLAKDERDVEETFLNSWMAGYATHNSMIALTYLIHNETLTRYVIKDGKEEYTLYTLAENFGKNWGQRMFKEQKELTVKKA